MCKTSRGVPHARILTWFSHGGTTIIVSGRDLELAEQVASRIVTLGKGHQILQQRDNGENSDTSTQIL